MKHFHFCLLSTILLFTAAIGRPVVAEPIPDPPPPSDNAAVWYLTAQQFMESYDQEAKAVIDKWDKPDLDLDLAAKVINTKLLNAMPDIRRGASLDNCSWAIDFKRDGFDALMPQLTMLREYGRILTVSAQVRLEAGAAEGAIEDYVAIMRMSRHAAADGSLIGCLVQFSLEKLAADALAKQLHRFDRAQLQTLREQLATLPPRLTVRSSIAVERQGGLWMRSLMNKALIEGDAEAMKALGLLGFGPAAGGELKNAEKQMKDWFDELDAFYQRLYGNLALPYDEFVKADQQFVEDVQRSKNLFVAMIMPALRPAYETERRTESLTPMLLAAIAYRLDGEPAFKQVVDPSDGKPFDLQMTDKGLVLSSRLKKNDQTLSLTFAKALAEPLK